MARREAVGHVNEQQPAPGQPRQLDDVLEDGFVGFRVLDGDENVVIHVQCPEKATAVWYSRYTFSAAMMMQTGHASALIQNLIANGPIILRLLVNCTSGKMANGS